MDEARKKTQAIRERSQEDQARRYEVQAKYQGSAAADGDREANADKGRGMCVPAHFL